MVKSVSHLVLSGTGLVDHKMVLMIILNCYLDIYLKNFHALELVYRFQRNLE